MRTPDLPSTPLLTAEEEKDLARRIEAGVYADHLLATGCPHWATTDELAAVKQDGEAAWNHFYTANLKLVMAVAWRWARLFRVDAEDVAQECCLALGGAIRAWDYRRGARFSTLAWPRLTVTAQKTCQDLRAMATVPSRWLEAQGLDVEAVPPREIDASDLVWSNVRWLPPLQRHVIEERFGFRTGTPHTYTAIAKEMNTTPYFVKRIETSAFAELESSTLKMAA